MNCDEYKKHCIEQAEKAKQERIKFLQEKLSEKFPLIEIAEYQDHPFCFYAKICDHTFYIENNGNDYYLQYGNIYYGGVHYIKDEADLGKYFEKQERERVEGEKREEARKNAVEFNMPEPEKLNEAGPDRGNIPWWKF